MLGVDNQLTPWYTIYRDKGKEMIKMENKKMVQQMINNWEDDIRVLKEKVDIMEELGNNLEAIRLIGQVQALNNCLYELTYKVFKHM